MAKRESALCRETRETKINAKLEICSEPSGALVGGTGVGFFDHMLNSFCVHGGFKLMLEASGDLDVDAHHTVEDTGIVLGRLFFEALGSRAGIARFGEANVPMDEALAFCAVDVSGRPFLVYDDGGNIKADKIGQYDTELNEEFFRAFATNAGFTLHITLKYGKNAHHCTEAMFKAVARAVRAATAETRVGVLSAKGVL